MLICVKSVCKCLIIKELRILVEVTCKDILFVKISKFDCRRKEFIFIYKR